MEGVTFLDIVTVVSLIGSGVAIVAAIVNGKRASNKDAAESAKQSGTVLTEIGYIKSGIDDIKRKQDAQDKVITDMAVDIATVKASTKQAHKRIDQIIGVAGRDAE